MAKEGASEELRLLYDISARDLEFFKNQQWRVSYYSIAILGALFALARLTTVPILVYCIAVGAITLFSSLILIVLEQSIGIRRKRLKAVRTGFSEKYESAWQAGEKLPDCHLVVALMLVTLIGGAVLTILGMICTVGGKL